MFTVSLIYFLVFVSAGLSQPISFENNDPNYDPSIFYQKETQTKTSVLIENNNRVNDDNKDSSNFTKSINTSADSEPKNENQSLYENIEELCSRALLGVQVEFYKVIDGIKKGIFKVNVLLKPIISLITGTEEDDDDDDFDNDNDDKEDDVDHSYRDFYENSKYTDKIRDSSDSDRMKVESNDLIPEKEKDINSNFSQNNSGKNAVSQTAENNNNNSKMETYKKSNDVIENINSNYENPFQKLLELFSHLITNKPTKGDEKDRNENLKEIEVERKINYAKKDNKELQPQNDGKINPSNVIQPEEKILPKYESNSNFERKDIYPEREPKISSFQDKMSHGNHATLSDIDDGEIHSNNNVTLESNDETTLQSIANSISSIFTNLF